jgi:hypothetical protein
VPSDATTSDSEAIIRKLHEWTGTLERYWAHQLNRIKEQAEKKEQEQA